MSYCECNSFERKLAYHTAPALLGIKPASLFSVCVGEITDDEMKKFNQKVVCKGLKLRIICKCENRRLIMLYNAQMLDLWLHKKENVALLEQYGYRTDMATEEMLERLSERIEKNGGFPHEIGIFLGYPVEDVCGFIKNGGDNFKLCGYWKVYGNAEKASRTFKNYDKCRSFLCNKLSQGADIYQALKIS